MKEIQREPPNIREIRRVLTPPQEAIFAYGDTLYNPSGGIISPDLWIHEAQHEKQQSIFTTPEVWWTRYLLDSEFRLNQEVEAYAVQLNYVRIHMPKAFKEALFDFASTLSGPMYALNISYIQAETLIRHKAKEMV